MTVLFKRVPAMSVRVHLATASTRHIVQDGTFNGA